MRKKILICIFILVTLSILSGCVFQKENSIEYGKTVKYTLYIGLNDKDTYTQLIPLEEAEKKVESIVLNYVDGFTLLYAKGAYEDDENIITYENSLVYEFYAATDNQMKAIMNDVLKALNQHSVLLEKQTVENVFYEGEQP